MSSDYHDLLECYPDQLEESLNRRDQWRRQAADTDRDLEYLVADLDTWRPGSTVTVGFLGGSPKLHRLVAEAVSEIERVCNLTFDFGGQGGEAPRRWTLGDEKPRADIRVSFDLKGFWSLVGTSSIDQRVGDAGSGVGGRPYQRSLNLGGFDRALPPLWRRIVLHLFLHVAGFPHKHHRLDVRTQGELRWEDDLEYFPTRDIDGRYLADERGRRPGLYTYLSGHPNFWPRAKVDHHLRIPACEGTWPHGLDLASVMTHRFSDLAYQAGPPTFESAERDDVLSAGDRRGLETLYPSEIGAAADRRRRCQAALRLLEHRDSTGQSARTDAASHVESSLNLLRRQAGLVTGSGWR